MRAHFPWVPAERIKVLSLGAGSIESFLDRGGPDKLEVRPNTTEQGAFANILFLLRT